MNFPMTLQVKVFPAGDEVGINNSIPLNTAYDALEIVAALHFIKYPTKASLMVA
jgi:hypothetical protein